jgi:hypothetical protein
MQANYLAVTADKSSSRATVSFLHTQITLIQRLLIPCTPELIQPNSRCKDRLIPVMPESLPASLQSKLAAHHVSAFIIKVVSTYLAPRAFVCDEDFAAFVVWGDVHEAYSVLGMTKAKEYGSV